MDSNPDTGQPDSRELVRQIRELERRIRALEEWAGSNPAPWTLFESAPKQQPAPAAYSREGSARAIPVLGKALLGIAGAYLLRALAEFKLVPLTAGVSAGILYALAWLVLAARAAPKDPFTGAVRGVTSALILVPLLWEATVRFRALPSGAAAGVLILFSSFGLAVSWRSNLKSIAWITTLAGLLTTAALLLATHDVAPFTLALLAIAAMVECSACLDHWLRERWVVALAVDLAVLLLIDVAARGAAVPDGYAPISPLIGLAALIALAAIYLLSTSVRALVCRAALTPFETAQIGLALLLFMSGVLRITHGSPVSWAAVSAFGLACGVMFYAFSFADGKRREQHGRNFYTYSTLGLLLVFAGSRIAFSGTVLILILSVLGLAALSVGRGTNRVILEWHAAAYLLLSALLSGLAGWAFARLLGARYGWVSPAGSMWIGLIAALLGYALISRHGRLWSFTAAHGVPVLTLAGSAAWAVAGLAAGAFTASCTGALAAPFCTTLRTFVLTAVAMLLAWCGTKWKRLELVWLVYPFMVLTAYKLLVQDLTQGETLSLFASLFLYGGALVLLPRILQKPKRE